MKILVLGGNGLLGQSIYFYFKKNISYDVCATIRNFALLKNIKNEKIKESYIAINDLTDFNCLEKLLMGNSPNVVINCTGILKIKNSEDFLNAIKINSILPIKLSLLAKSYGFRLIHFSTDGVFDGSKGNYYEQDEINLLDSYGQTKYLGEVIENEAFTIRTSIIGHQYYTEEGLVNWFLNSKDSVNGYSNYIYSGLPAVEIARIIDEFILPNIDLNGLYHISSNPMSKFDILNLMASIYGKKIEIIPLPNPKIDRSLNDSKFRNDSGYKPKSWDNLIIEMKNDFQENLSKYFK